MPKQAAWALLVLGAISLGIWLTTNFVLGPATITDISWSGPPSKIARQMEWLGFEHRHGGEWRGSAFGLEDATVYISFAKTNPSRVDHVSLWGDWEISSYQQYQHVRAYLDEQYQLLQVRELSLKSTEKATVQAVYHGTPLKRFYSARSGAMLMLSLTQDDYFVSAAIGGGLLKGCTVSMQLIVVRPGRDLRKELNDHCTPPGPGETAF